MTINLTDPANHPANGPLTVERIIRVREELQRSLQYQNGGDMAYIITDAIKRWRSFWGAGKLINQYRINNRVQPV
ncbi:TPA: hypothetical protein VCC33_002267 [Kluyvera cryocrescens]|nr:hypothetical protein [Kluyvera cryocrescens]